MGTPRAVEMPSGPGQAWVGDACISTQRSRGWGGGGMQLQAEEQSVRRPQTVGPPGPVYSERWHVQVLTPEVWKSPK